MAVVADFNYDRVVITEGPNPQHTPALQSVYGVFDEVGPYLIQLECLRY